MKHTSPQGMNNLSFDELVQRAKSSEAELNAMDLNRMVARFEERLRAEGAQAAAQTGNAGSAAAASASATKGVRQLSPASKALLGGAGLAAVAAFIYGTTVPSTSVAPVPSLADATSVASVVIPIAPRVETPNAPHEGTTPAVAADDTHVPLQAAANRARKGSNATRLETRVAATIPVADVSPTPSAEPLPTAPLAPVTSKPAPALDTSLAQLERAERELRSGNPKAALVTLTEPIVPSLSSRAEALRAVALCQSGQAARGAAMAQRHLANNPSSPYEKRLTAACGHDL